MMLQRIPVPVLGIVSFLLPSKAIPTSPKTYLASRKIISVASKTILEIQASFLSI